MKVTVNTLHTMAAEGQKIAMMTCYDTSFASLLDGAGVDIMLIGDSLGMVIQGEDSTLPVSLDEMVYHTRCVEGGAFMADTVRFLVQRGVPVCAHIGLTPQFVNTFGGYKVQGKSESDAERIIEEARVLAEAGASLVLMECVPAALAKRVTEAVKVPTIGIGAGPDVSGQVLVLHDVLGVFPGKKARFVKNFMDEAQSIQGAVGAYVSAVKDGSFPAPEHCF